MVLSYGYENGSQNILITLQSIGNSVGRVASGFIVDLVRKYISVPSLILFICIITFLTQVLFLFAIDIWALCIASVFCGLCYGAMVAVMPNYVAEEWGTKYFATNWGQLFPSLMLGNFLIGSFMPGLIYDAQVPKDSKECKGVYCYRWSFMVTTGVNYISVILSMLLVWLYKRKQWRADKQQNDSINSLIKN
jgi:MFS family permease